jgi:tetratricopeptide (TPR) repeat protein
MPFGFNKSDKDKLGELLVRARELYDKARVENAEETWRQAVTLAEQHEDLMGLVVVEAIAFGEKQSMFGDFDLANAKFEQALRIMALDLDCPDVLYAMTYSKSAANETGRGRDEEAMRCFKLAVNHFAKADDLAGLELGYADCQHQFGRTLQRLKNFTAAVDALEKALKLYGLVVDLPENERQQRISTLRSAMLQCAQLAKGAQKERLQKRVEKVLGLSHIVYPPSFAKALEALQKEGFATALTSDISKRLLKQCAPDDEDSGDWTLLEVLRKYYEEVPSTSAADLLVYAEPATIDEANAILADLSARLGEPTVFKIFEWDGTLFTSMCIGTTDGEEGMFTYNGIENLVEFYNLRLEKKKDPRRFYALDAAEDEAVYFLMHVDVHKRLEELRVLPFVGM